MRDIQNEIKQSGTHDDDYDIAYTTNKVAFGKEGELFSRELAIPTVVCGPGSMAQGHKPDEYVEVEQITRCDAMLDTLLDRLVEGI